MYAQNWVARVWTPIGTMTRVSVSSVTVDKKTKEKAAANPGPTRGSTTRHHTWRRVRPRLRPTSSRASGAWATEVRTATRARGKNMIP